MSQRHSEAQLERTVLSWSRTSLAALALAAASIKAGLARSDAATLVTGGLALAAAVVLYGSGRFRATRSAALGRYGSPTAMRLVAGVCVAAQCAAGVAIALRLFGE